MILKGTLFGVYSGQRTGDRRFGARQCTFTKFSSIAKSQAYPWQRHSRIIRGLITSRGIARSGDLDRTMSGNRDGKK
jgi:hypothetical protein